jgi:two-component system sensor histidine kinase/response regulator
LYGKRLLVVDSHGSTRTVIRYYCEQAGMVVTDADDVGNALKATAGAVIDVVILGHEICEQEGLSELRARLKTQGTAFILMHSIAEAQNEAKGSCGDFLSLRKPVAPGALWMLLRRCLISARSEGDESESATVSKGALSAENGLLRVLVVDDNPVNRKVAVRILEKLGVQCEAARNGREALAMMETSPFSAVLMDFHMPEMDGLDTTKELRRREGKGRRTPVIAMTASVMEEDRQKCMAAGMDDFMAKPIQMEEISRMLNKWLSPARHTV